MKHRKPTRPGSGHQWSTLRGYMPPSALFAQAQRHAEAKGRKSRQEKLARLYANNARIIRARREALLTAIGMSPNTQPA